ncbi:MAG TPA: hypothetical protein VLL52_23415 [Anaerolineae bacterium]|nr:hypothetical protein [Anaerolineae bacterium]
MVEPTSIIPSVEPINETVMTPTIVWSPKLIELKEWVLQDECDYPCLPALVSVDLNKDEMIRAFEQLQEQDIITKFDLDQRGNPFYILHFNYEHSGALVFFDQTPHNITAISVRGMPITLNDIFITYGESPLVNVEFDHGIVYFYFIYPNQNIMIATSETFSVLLETTVTADTIIDSISFDDDLSHYLNTPYWTLWEGYQPYGYYLNKIRQETNLTVTPVSQ